MTQAFNLSQFANKVNTSGQADLTTAVTGTLPVSNGGTGATTLTANNVILGNGTSAPTFVAPGTTGNVLTSNGTTWTSAAGGAYAGFTTVIFSSSGSWTPPAGITRAVVICVGGGGGAGGSSNVNTRSGAAGAGGLSYAYVTSLSGTYTITVGGGGTGVLQGNGTAGTSSSFGALVTATGGGGGSLNGVNGTAGTGSTSGTLLRNASTSLNVVGLGGTLTRVSGSGRDPVAWDPTSLFLAGAGASATSNGSNTGSGGVGGMVMIQY
jgi:hypothetical protein